MNDILVLLSSYNGEKYIQKQLDSILNQSNVNVQILIRDDGSTDGTLNLLKEYERVNSNIMVVQGENIGVVESFNKLVLHEKCSSFQYFAFADQDDEWVPNKAETAIRAINEHSAIPCLYSSNPVLIDRDGNEMGKMRNYQAVINEKSSIVENFAPGCTTVFNKSARDVYLQGVGKYMEMHDYWMYLCCVFLGKVIYSEIPTTMYRQHDSNAVGSREKVFSRFIGNLLEANDHKRERFITNFVETYKAQLALGQREMLYHVTRYRSTIKDYFWLLFSKGFFSGSYGMLFAFKIRVALRKM